MHMLLLLLRVSHTMSSLRPGVCWSAVLASTLTASVDWRLTLWASIRCTGQLHCPHLIMIFMIAGVLVRSEHGSSKVQVHGLSRYWHDCVTIHYPILRLGLWWTDGRTDKVIAVTLCLRFAARVNKNRKYPLRQGHRKGVEGAKGR